MSNPSVFFGGTEELVDTELTVMLSKTMSVGLCRMSRQS
jgi:hypothetical protein